MLIEKRKRDYNKKPLTEEEIEWAYRKSAELVANRGDSFLPIFERFQKEMEVITHRRKLREVAQNVANEIE